MFFDNISLCVEDLTSREKMMVEPLVDIEDVLLSPLRKLRF